MDEPKTHYRDISFEKFHHLTALYPFSRDKQGRIRWACVCDCGTDLVVASRHLVQGRQQTCGCNGAEVRAENGKRGAAKMRGSQSHLYNQNLTDEQREDMRILHARKLKDWRTAVFERDGFKCDICGSGGKLNAHHLNSWRAHEDYRYDLENGVTLCKEHHFEFHMSLGGYRTPCTREDYNNYKKKKK